MTTIDLIEPGAQFFAPVSTDAISGMVAQYDAVRGRIEQISSIVTGEMAAAMSYFLDGNTDSNSRYSALNVERLFKTEGAVAALNAAYWSKALALTDVLDLMPQKRRDEWNKSIIEQTTPDFTEDTVRNTLADLINMRAKFFAERVDGISGSTTGQGAFAVADPRPGMRRERGDHYLTAGHYGVVPWNDPAGAVSAAAGHDNGRWSVADPRVCDSVQVEGFSMPALTDKLVCRIQALDGTWHRPFTTLELAALQSLLDPEDTWVPWQLDGENDQDWRERIGNAVPSDAATGIGDVMGETLLLAWSGETFRLSAQPIWVRPVAVALSVQGQA